MNNSGQTDRMFEFADALVGHYKGGLAYVNILASLIFSGISGSALADIGGVGKILMETMRENGYGSAYSAAITGVSSTAGPIFPPSIPLIIYGILAEVSVLELLVAGIVPGLLRVVALTAIMSLLAELKEMPTSRQASRRETFGALYRGLPALLAPVVLVGGMLRGILRSRRGRGRRGSVRRGCRNPRLPKRQGRVHLGRSTGDHSDDRHRLLHPHGSESLRVDRRLRERIEHRLQCGPVFHLERHPRPASDERDVAPAGTLPGTALCPNGDHLGSSFRR